MLWNMSLRYTYPGACHCRNVELLLESDKTPPELGLRGDTCSFCAKHHALYTSDPEGELHLTLRDADVIQRYRFGHKTADFLSCKTCGVFVAAHMPESRLAVVNVHVLDARATFLAEPLHLVDLDGESVEKRLARRHARWTPVRSFLLGGAPMPQTSRPGE
jgi:hypothetical protein